MDVTDSTRIVTPVLFTRNLEIDSLSTSAESALTENPPLGESGVVVINKGGGACFYKRRDLGDSFNPAGAKNRVLRP